MDRYLIESRQNTHLKLHKPYPAGIALQFDRPWEGPFCGYVTVLRDGPVFRMYYRGLPEARADGSDQETTCYAQSKDGVNWEKPDLGLFEVRGTKANNVLLAGHAPFSHNFSPFLDTRPDVPSDQRFKAMAGTSQSGLVPFVSGDGIHWRKLQEKPVFTQGAFDSQNVAFWSEHEKAYLLYFRSWSQGEFKGFRTISRTTSKDFLNWTPPVPMTFGESPMEHLYTNQTHPYFRAPHLYVAVPMRFMPGRKVLTAAQANALQVNPDYASDCAEAVLMTSRGGNRYDRTFMEGFIRPGTDPGNWASRAGLTALGILPTGPAEMSLYKQAHYAQPSNHLVRYTLRTDGFVSVNAPYAGGELLTRPLRFSGTVLSLNLSTGAAGGMRIEIQQPDGKPIPGFALSDARELIGDDIDRVAQWSGGSNLKSLIGQTVRLRVVMKDADLFSWQFREA